MNEITLNYIHVKDSMRCGGPKSKQPVPYTDVACWH